MNVNVRSNQPSRDPLQNEAASDSLSSDGLPERSSGRVFYIVSAGLHIAAVAALSGSWLFGSLAGNKSASAAPPTPEKPPAARMAIDVGPIKFCEMNIETLIGRPQSQPGR